MADVSKPRGAASLTAEELEFRDDAALAALSGLMADAVSIQKMVGEATGMGIDVTQYAAEASYEFADAMLAARKGGGGA